MTHMKRTAFCTTTQKALCGSPCIQAYL